MPSDSSKTQGLDISSDKSDGMTYSVSSGFLHSVTTITNIAKLWCQARVLLLAVQLVGKMSTSKLICYFFQSSSSMWFLGFFTTDNATLNPAKNKMISLPDFQSDIGAVVHATLDMKQLISHTRMVPLDTIACVQLSDRRISFRSA